ncbi:PAAR-like domain-containing protein [uncultured Sulfitobacter sp.]|uniref:PAAR-like domain-containing protein n=1 Tax=uncultured Sulfitobacter sp. TaxID=191468 RepID=UPI002634BE86|nr:PAAR-like domain-containing protein [uncultured Sulfitobacter sp.]
MSVFANKLEVSCKAQANKIVSAFPDVCMTPPEAPPTPPGVPIPYPNFGMDSDTDKGTGTVKIGGKTVNQKNKSYFTKTTGDEAGAAAKKGVVSSKNTGKSYSQAFSMDVKAEGKNLTRFSDISTNNHGSPPNVPPFPKIGLPNPPSTGDPCADNDDAIEKACGDKSKDEVCAAGKVNTGPATKKGDAGGKENTGSDAVYGTAYGAAGNYEDRTNKSGAPSGKFRDKKRYMDEWESSQADDCLAASRCRLEPYNGGNCCCPGQTGHHLVDAACFNETGRGDKPKEGETGPPQLSAIKEGQRYDPNKAPVICAEGPSATKGSHGALHTEMKSAIIDATGPVDPRAGDKNIRPEVSFGKDPVVKKNMRSLEYGEFKQKAIEGVAVVFPKSQCNPDCLAAQLDAYHKDELGIEDDTPVRAALSGRGADSLDLAKDYNEARRKAVAATLPAPAGMS